MANPHRGDVPITLKHHGTDREFVMRPTFGAIAEIEQATGRGLIALARSAMAGDVALSTMAVVVTAGLKAAGEPAKAATVGEMVFEAGALATLPAVGQFLTNALTGGRERGPNRPR